MVMFARDPFRDMIVADALLCFSDFVGSGLARKAAGNI